MVFVQNRQNATKRNINYVAKQFDLFWIKKVVFSPIFCIMGGLRASRKTN